MGGITLEWLLPDGQVGGRADDGRAVRVTGAVPGDVVQLGHDGGLAAILAPSPDRRAPPCPWTAACGGCDLDALTPEARHRALARMVARAFRHDGEVPVVPSPRPTAHRARIKLAVDDGRAGYRAPRSHDLVEPEVCAIARPEVQQAHRRLRDWLATHGGSGTVELRSDGTRVVHAFEGTFDRAALAELGDVALDGRRLHGDPVLHLEVDGVRLRCSPASFYQVNLEANALLVAHVRDTLLAAKAERVLDLYAGIGNLSLPLARRGIPVTAVEAPGPGVEDLRANARQLPAQVSSMRVERFDTSRAVFDAVVLDPPRAGAPGVLAKVARNRPRVVVYVSCFAPSAARDLKELRGYRKASVHAFDLFPDTHHVETVVVLERA